MSVTGRGQGATPTEWYGFVGWISSGVAYVIFLVWAFFPEPVLQALGVTYYPSKYWALGILTWLVAAAVFAFWAYESLCMMSIPPAEDERHLQDPRSRTAQEVGLEDDMGGCQDSIPPLVDIPITKVCEMIYLTRATTPCQAF